MMRMSFEMIHQLMNSMPFNAPFQKVCSITVLKIIESILVLVGYVFKVVFHKPHFMVMQYLKTRQAILK